MTQRKGSTVKRRSILTQQGHQIDGETSFSKVAMRKQSSRNNEHGDSAKVVEQRLKKQMQNLKSLGSLDNLHPNLANGPATVEPITLNQTNP